MRDSEGRLRIEVVLVLLAIGLGIIESMMPKPLPFLRFGMANVVTVAAIWKIGFRTALMINIIRSLGTAFYLGTVATPTFILSLSGGITSVLIMGGLKKSLSITGISVSGSTGSLLVQLSVAGLILPGLPLGELIPLVTVWGVVSGAVTGILAAVLLRRGFPWIGESGVDSPCLPT